LALTMRRRGSMTPAMVAAPGAMGSPPAGGVQMSTDGKYWWDGQNWRDAATETPPSAQRSSDGALWWDGQNWRPVPHAGPPQQPERFVSGYGRSWVQQASSHLLLEIVIAFSGGSGAKKWLGTSQELDKADQFYKSAMSITGIETAYGVHFADPTTPAYADVAYFVKGNDY